MTVHVEVRGATAFGVAAHARPTVETKRRRSPDVARTARHPGIRAAGAGTSGRAHRRRAGLQRRRRPHGVEQGQFTADLAAVLRGFGTMPVPVIAVDRRRRRSARAHNSPWPPTSESRPAHSVIGVPAAKLGLVVDHWTVRRFADEFSPPVARSMLLGAETYTAERLHDARRHPPSRNTRRRSGLGRRTGPARTAHDRRSQDRAGAPVARARSGRSRRGGASAWPGPSARTPTRGRRWPRVLDKRPDVVDSSGR